MNAADLAAILAKHKLWLEGSPNGERANLRSADLRSANLSSADLSSADLSWADLSWANLSSADLSWANLSDTLEDFRAVLDAAPLEVAGVLLALDAGHIDGSVYDGDCACLVGTIANLRGCNYTALTNGLAPNSDRPAERWFLGIGRGATADNNAVAALTREWIVAWQAERGEGELITGDAP